MVVDGQAISNAVHLGDGVYIAPDPSIDWQLVLFVPSFSSGTATEHVIYLDTYAQDALVAYIRKYQTNEEIP